MAGTTAKDAQRTVWMESETRLRLHLRLCSRAGTVVPSAMSTFSWSIRPSRARSGTSVHPDRRLPTSRETVSIGWRFHRRRTPEPFNDGRRRSTDSTSLCATGPATLCRSSTCRSSSGPIATTGPRYLMRSVVTLWSFLAARPKGHRCPATHVLLLAGRQRPDHVFLSAKHIWRPRSWCFVSTTDLSTLVLLRETPYSQASQLATVFAPPPAPSSPWARPRGCGGPPCGSCS